MRIMIRLSVLTVAILQVCTASADDGKDLFGFRFQHHFVDRDLPGSQWGQTALVDIDRDGDLDFITGQTKGDVRWYEFHKEDKTWTLHLLGRDSPSDVGGLAIDVDRDGRVDFVTGGAWYHQPPDAKSEPWPRHVFDKEDTKVHDIIAADVDGDGRDEVVTLSDKSNLRLYRIPAGVPTATWAMEEIWPGVHAGLSAGDIDNDGDIDLVRSQVWLENINGGKTWKEHKFCGIPWANRKEHYFYYLASRSWVSDINRDGRQDIVLTENEIPGGRVAWFEAPEDPTQTNWQPHFLEPSDDEARGPYHSLQLADFDNDGDMDVFAGEMEHLANPPHRWFIWENVRGDGSQFTERVVLNSNLGTHESKAGDVDGDGDIDLVGKLWRPVADNGNRGHNHVDFLENLSSGHASEASGTEPPTAESIGLEFIDTSFENASPLHYEVDADGNINVFLVYDHERSSPNRAAGHWHFRVQARKGSQQTIIFNNLLNTWNGKQSSIAKPGRRFTCHVSSDGRNWQATELEVLSELRIKLSVEMKSGSLFVARTEPYRLSDLDRLLTSIKDNPLVAITPIGKTVEGRQLEIVRIGNESAPNRLFLRARAHAFEAGGNWVVQGVVNRLLKGDADARQYLERYCVYILPMANKDSVARGRTRFNSMGWDLNRKWDKPADPQLAPENHALEVWLERMVNSGRQPHLAIDFHNDSSGKIHVSRPEPANPEYLANMEKYETLLRKHTWFTEGSTGKTFRNPGTIGEGLLSRFNIHACVHELNVEWIHGLSDYPSGKNWELLGTRLCEVYFQYFAAELESEK